MIIFRNDDVSSNTNIMALNDLYDEIRGIYPDCVIVSGITLFSRGGIKGSVYDEIPFKDKEVNWFYDVDSVFSSFDKLKSKIASHGMIHVDHSKLSKDAQEMSILSSCKFLNTRLFIPPFNRFNEDTIDICFKNDIDIFSGNHWKSLDFRLFDDSHKYWYFHSWKFKNKTFKEILDENRRNLGQLQTNS